jgi:membrane protein YdbS with pleckstrin-like domain
MNRLSSMIPIAIVLIVAVSMGIGAAVLGYPAWAIPLIALLGAVGAVGAVRLISKVSESFSHATRRYKWDRRTAVDSERAG